jgi:hypothetical protein
MTWDYYNLYKTDLKDQSSDFKLKKIDNIMRSFNANNISSEKALELIKKIVNEEPKKDNLKNLMRDMGKTPFDLRRQPKDK